jgi:hypothetical protein
LGWVNFELWLSWSVHIIILVFLCLCPAQILQGKHIKKGKQNNIKFELKFFKK